MMRSVESGREHLIYSDDVGAAHPARGALRQDVNRTKKLDNMIVDPKKPLTNVCF